MKKIGIFGGSFDPFHNGHLSIAKYFVEKCNLDKCIIVPAKCSPFKIEKKKFYSDSERIKIIEKQIATIDKLELSKYEIENKNEISYSIDTIRHFKNIFPNFDLCFLIGYDVALDFDKWKDYKKILEVVKVVIASRGSDNYINNNILEKIFGIDNYILLNNSIIDISSTYIRKNITK